MIFCNIKYAMIAYEQLPIDISGVPHPTGDMELEEPEPEPTPAKKPRKQSKKVCTPLSKKKLK